MPTAGEILLVIEARTRHLQDILFTGALGRFAMARMLDTLMTGLSPTVVAQYELPTLWLQITVFGAAVSYSYVATSNHRRKLERQPIEGIRECELSGLDTS